ncbi:MAG: ComEA family DNA-binding protein [Gammaproteobacteria bacterium]
MEHFNLMERLMWKNLAVAVLLSASSFTFAAGSVDINTADAVTLAQGLHGVGPAKAEAIVAYREKNGPFKSVDELVAVQGIGEQTVKINREHMTVGAPSPSE